MADRLDVVVIGAGIGGLGAALLLGRAGHRVTLVERDDTPMPADVEGAFRWDRRGAPQVRHPHAFLGLGRTIVRDRAPDVLARLLEVGVHEVPIHDALFSIGPRLREIMDADDDLKLLGCRRTTFEWVLRSVVLEEPTVDLRLGSGVQSLVHRTDGVNLPTITGVVLEDGTEISSDLVVAASGRRGDVGRWLEPLGVSILEEASEAGVVYVSRFYHTDRSSDFGFQLATGPNLGGGLIGADNGTFSISLAVGMDDWDLRRLLNDSDRFDAVVDLLPDFAKVAEIDRKPINDVHTMTGLINRRRHYTDAFGQPLVSGLVALGDVHTCTNPFYGRGQSLALRQAADLADALASHRDVTEAAATYEAAAAKWVTPWYQLSVLSDQVNAQRFDLSRVGSDQPDPVAAGGNDLTSLLSALERADDEPEVGHLLVRTVNLLEPASVLIEQLPRLLGMLRPAKAEAPAPRPTRRRVTRDQVLAVA